MMWMWMTTLRIEGEKKRRKDGVVVVEYKENNRVVVVAEYKENNRAVVVAEAEDKRRCFDNESRRNRRNCQNGTYRSACGKKEMRKRTNILEGTRFEFDSELDVFRLPF